MLRDLVDLVHSIHSQFVFSGDETIENFEKALNMESERLKGQKIPIQTTVVNKLFYTNLSLIDTFQNRIYLIFLHTSFLFIKLKQNDKNQFYKVFIQKVILPLILE